MYLLSGFYSLEAAINSYWLGTAPEQEASFVVPQFARWNHTSLQPTLSAELTQQPFTIWASCAPKWV